MRVKGGGESLRRRSGGRRKEAYLRTRLMPENSDSYRPEFSFNNRVIIHRGHLLLDSKSARSSSLHSHVFVSSFRILCGYAQRVPFPLRKGWINRVSCRSGGQILLGSLKNGISVWCSLSVDYRKRESRCLSLVGNFNCLITEVPRAAPALRATSRADFLFSRSLVSSKYASSSRYILRINLGHYAEMLGYGESKSYPRARNMRA